LFTFHSISVLLYW